MRVRGGAVWAAIALDGGSRLWLATAVARRRDGLLVHLLLRRTLATVAGRAFLLAVDGFAGYVGAAWSLIRVPKRTGRQARPPLVWPEGFALAQVVKAGLHRSEGIARRVVVGTEATVAAALAAGLAARPYGLAELLRRPVHPVPLTAPRAPRRGRSSTRGRLIPFPPHQQRPQSNRPYDHGCVWLYPTAGLTSSIRPVVCPVYHSALP